MGKKILLADDSITIQKVIELTFSDEDFEVVTVGNGRLAHRARAGRRGPTSCSATSSCRRRTATRSATSSRRTRRSSHIPVLLLTGAFEPFDQERAARVGCDGFLAKPFEPQTLIAKVKDLLRAERQAARRPAAGRGAARARRRSRAPSAPATPAVAEAAPFGTPAARRRALRLAEPRRRPAASRLRRAAGVPGWPSSSSPRIRSRRRRASRRCAARTCPRRCPSTTPPPATTPRAAPTTRPRPRRATPLADPDR